MQIIVRAVACASLMAAVVAASPAAVIHKCIDANGQASYQSAPCAKGSEQAWVRDVASLASATPSPAASKPAEGQATQAAERGTPRSGEASRRAVTSTVPTKSRPPTHRKADSAACQRAHAADAAYRAQPLGRVRHDGLRRHGDRIRAACG